MKKIKVAVIGLGRNGMALLKACAALKDTVAVAGICEADTVLGHKAAREYDVPFCPDFHKLIGKIDAVLIFSPLETHFEIGHFFLDNGVHALIEGPVTSKLPLAEELIRISRFKNAKLQISHAERFFNAFSSIKDILEGPRLIQCARFIPPGQHPKPLDVILDLMLPDIDTAQSLISAPVKDIQAMAISLLGEKNDAVNARITFANGSICDLTAGRIAAEATHKVRILTPHACISLDLVGHKGSVIRRDGLNLIHEDLPLEKKEPLQKELEHFLDCIREDKAPLISGENGRDALKTALMIQETLWTRPPVKS